MHDTAAVQPASASLMGLVRLMRPRQWIKNIFVFAPLVFTGAFLDAHSAAKVALAALLFCIASSAAYIVNDLHDIAQDRLHPVKSRTRPLAAGVVTVRAALLLLAVHYGLLVGGWVLAPRVTLVIVAYLLLNIVYSAWLKHQPVLDIFSIALGFVLRVHAGAMALSVPVSGWMFITTLCLALYLAAIKRRQELLQSGAGARKVLAKYPVTLVERYAEISATGALVFYAMFVMSAKPQLVVTVPLVLFGLFRYWYVVEEMEGGESPTDAVLTDWQLLVTIVLWVGACVWALWPAAS